MAPRATTQAAPQVPNALSDGEASSCSRSRSRSLPRQAEATAAAPGYAAHISQRQAEGKERHIAVHSSDEELVRKVVFGATEAGEAWERRRMEREEALTRQWMRDAADDWMVLLLL